MRLLQSEIRCPPARDRAAGRPRRVRALSRVGPASCRSRDEAVTTLRGLQPPGTPYRIAGYSMAGLIAYEVAGLLAAQGEAVEWLGLVDTYSPSQAAREFSIAVYLERSRGRSLRKSAASAMARVRTESTVRYTDAAARLRRRPLDRFDELGARRLMRGYTPNGSPGGAGPVRHPGVVGARRPAARAGRTSTPVRCRSARSAETTCPSCKGIRRGASPRLSCGHSPPARPWAAPCGRYRRLR